MPTTAADTPRRSWRDPDGLVVDLVASPGDTRSGWDGEARVPAEHAVRGLHSVTLTERQLDPTSARDCSGRWNSSAEAMLAPLEKPTAHQVPAGMPCSSPAAVTKAASSSVRACRSSSSNTPQGPGSGLVEG